MTYTGELMISPQMLNRKYFDYSFKLNFRYETYPAQPVT